MIKIPFSNILGERYAEICQYLDANCIPSGVLAQWSPDRDRRMYSLFTKYDNYWTVTVQANCIEVTVFPEEHETFLALKYGVI